MTEKLSFWVLVQPKLIIFQWIISIVQKCDVPHKVDEFWNEKSFILFFCPSLVIDRNTESLYDKELKQKWWKTLQIIYIDFYEILSAPTNSEFQSKRLPA